MTETLTAPEPTKSRRGIPAPIAMLAELTHRCPLSCPYCSNPLEMVRRDSELSTETWADVFRQAADLGVLSVALRVAPYSLLPAVLTSVFL